MSFVVSQDLADKVYTRPLMQLRDTEKSILASSNTLDNMLTAEDDVWHNVVKEITSITFEHVINTHHSIVTLS